jgi:creatinine amidohydrolase
MEPKCDVLIAPTVPYGSTDYLADFPGTVNLGYDVLYAVVSKITESLYHHGARKFLFMNGHGGNNAALQQVCMDLDRKNAMGCILNWWTLAWTLDPAWVGGHGGGEETAAMMAIGDDLVDKSLMADANVKDLTENLKTSNFGAINFRGFDILTRRNVRKMTDNGWIGVDHPTTATREWGQKMLEGCAQYALDFIEEFKKVEL